MNSGLVREVPRPLPGRVVSVVIRERPTKRHARAPVESDDEDEEGRDRKQAKVPVAVGRPVIQVLGNETIEASTRGPRATGSGAPHYISIGFHVTRCPLARLRLVPSY